MKCGRNELCPCGSGQKYKKCCLPKDHAAEQAQFSRIEAERFELALADSEQTAAHVPKPKPAPLPPAPKPPLDPHIEAINARWDEFNEATDEVRRDTFIKTLAEPELMDDTMAFEMLDVLYASAVKSGERDRFEELVDQLRERLPEVYATSRKYYLQWRIENAQASHRPERVHVHALEIAELAGDNVDQFAHVVDLLAYHGYLETLAEASRIAWPLIKASSDILWGQSDFARWGADCVLFERLERSRDLDGHDPELIEQTRFFFEDLRLDPFAQYVEHLSGRANRTWTLSDFQKPPRHRKKKRELDSDDEDNTTKTASADDREALAYLLDEFVDYARHQAGVPYTKAALARENIGRYLLQRQAGDLEPRQSMFNAMLHPQQNRKPKPRVPDHPLAPDRDTLDRYFADLLDFMNPQLYDVAATFELMPTWLRFLESRGLLEPTQRDKTLTELHRLHVDLLGLGESDRTDPLLLKNLQLWPEMAQRPNLVAEGR